MNKPSPTNPKGYSIEPFVRSCPACDRPLGEQEQLVAGVCARCKSVFIGQHAKILKPGYNEAPGPMVPPKKIREQGFFDEKSVRVTTTADEKSGESAVIHFCETFAVNLQTGMQMLAWASEHGFNTGIGLEAHMKFRENFTAGWANLQRYVKKHGDRDMAERCLFLLLREPLLAGAADLAQLVKRSGRDKQTVNKCLQYFQAQMPSLPILEGQRGKKARENMVKARVEQLPVAASPANGKMDMRLKEKLTTD